MPKIFFLGGGHGGLAAFRSLQNAFSEITVLTDDAKLVNSLRPQDHLTQSLDPITEKVGIMAGFKQILPAHFLEQRLVLNIHYSLLPHLRGLHSVVWAILNGDSRVGWTVHGVEKGIDSGPIYYQSVHSYQGQTSQELMTLFDAEVQTHLGEIALKISFNQLVPRVQNHELATWVPQRNKADCLIQFNSTVTELERLFKALVFPYPRPSLTYKGVTYEVEQAELIKKTYVCTLGRVVHISDDGVYVKIQDGLLVLKRLSTEDGTSFDARNVLPLGARLQ